MPRTFRGRAYLRNCYLFHNQWCMLSRDITASFRDEERRDVSATSGTHNGLHLPLLDFRFEQQEDQTPCAGCP